MKFLYTCFSFLVLYFNLNNNLNAQNNIIIKGTILDSVQQQPLFPASLSLLNYSDSTVIKGGITNIKGNFSFFVKKSSKYLLQISYLGYKSQTKLINLNKQSIIDTKKHYLTPNNFELDDVNIICEPLLHFNDENVIINIEAMGNVEDMSVADVVKIVPGVYFDFDGKLRYKGYGNFTKLIGGKQIGSSTFSTSASGKRQYFELKQIPAKHIKKIEILPEPKGKYGYFIPIINIVPKGNLTTYYDINTEIGLKDKYQTEGTVTKQFKKFLISTRILCKKKYSIQNIKHIKKTFTTPKKTINEHIKQQLIHEEKNALLKSYYDFKSTSSISLSCNIKSSNDNNKYFYYSGYNYNQFTKSRIKKIKPFSINSKLKFRHNFHLTPRKGLIVSFNAAISFRNNKNIDTSNDILNQVNQNKLKSIKNNTKILADIFYYSSGKKIKYSIRGKFNFENETNKNEQIIFKPQESSWIINKTFSQHLKYDKINYSLNTKINKKQILFGLTHKLTAKLEGKCNTEKIYNLINYTHKTDFKLYNTYQLSTNTNFKIFGNVNLCYLKDLKWPSIVQKVGSPTHVNTYLIEKGNPNLKLEKTYRYSIDITWNPAGVIRYSKNIQKTPIYGYALNLSYHKSEDKIIKTYENTSTGLLIGSYSNAKAYKSFKMQGHIHRNVFKKANIKIGGTYSCENYFEIHNEKYLNKWQANTTLKINILKNIDLETNYTYYSSFSNYNTKTNAHQKLSFSLSGIIFKNSIFISLTALNLLKACNKSILINNKNYIDYRKNYLERPILKFFIAYKFYKFYSRKK